MRIGCLGVFLLFLSACPPAVDTGADGSGLIFAGPEGGIFIREGVAIEIPKGALTNNVQISVTAIDALIPDVPGRKRISYGYRFSPSTLTFSQPVKITVPWLEDRLPQAVPPSTFDMRRQGGEDAYIELPNAQANIDRKWLDAQTERLGLFWLTSPSQADVTNFEVSPNGHAIRVGDTIEFTATATNAAGDTIPLSVSWAVVPSRAASIDATGTLTALGPGYVTVSATADELTATADLRILGTTVGPTTFTHDNPFPTGNDLFGGMLLQGQAVVVGANANVLRHDVSTNEWERVVSGTAMSLKAVAGPSLSQAVAVGISGTSGVLIEVSGSAEPQVSTFETIQPRAVWFDGTFGMAVGSGNDVLIRQAGKWVSDFSPSFETLLAVQGDGNGAFTTVGSRGSMYHYEPLTMSWNSLFESQLSVLLTHATWAPNGAWAVGGKKLWHFSGGAWTAFNIPSSPSTDELTAVGAMDDAVLVGGRLGKTGHLFVFRPQALGGNEWSAFPLRGPQIIRGIFSDGDKAYAVGDLGAVWTFDGTSLTELSSGFYDDVVDLSVTASAVFAAINQCADSACSSRRGKVMRRVGEHQWEEVGTAPFIGPVYAIAAQGPSDIFAGGEGEIYHFDGIDWVPVSLGVSTIIRDLQFCDSVLYGVGEGGAIFRGTANALAVLNNFTSRNLYSIHCQNESQLWATGDFGLFEKTGRTNFAPRSTQGVNHAEWRAVWSPGATEAFSFGDARYGVYWNGQRLNVIESPGGNTGLWGSSVDNLYLIGEALLPEPFGYALRFDGVNWNLIDSGTDRKPTTIFGDSATNIWLGTEGGGILRAVQP